MADTKITALAAISTIDVNPATSPIPIVDLLDNSMAASGTTKKVTVNQILGAGGTATLASATITGDLTVDTSTLKVDSANDRVGIGTASPVTTFQVQDAVLTGAGQIRELLIKSNSNTVNNSLNSLIGVTFNSSALAYTAGSLERTSGVYGINLDNAAFGRRMGLVFYTSEQDLVATEKYRIDNSGVATWSNVGGVANTAMTLNSTGLGVGGSPATKIFANVTPPGAGQDGMRVSDGTRLIQMSISGSTYSYQGIGANQNVIYASGNPLSILSDAQNLRLGTSSTSYLLLDTSGNVGIGVTPSAWGIYKGLQVGYASLAGYAGSDTLLGSNVYFDGGAFRYIAAGLASSYRQLAGGHQWSTAVAGANPGDPLTLLPQMTLDASGNLLVGDSTGDVGRLFVRRDSLTDQVVQIQNEAATGKMITFHTNGMSEVGSISYGISSVAYNTSSDYRLKESVKPISGGLARVNALKPSAYKWKIDGSNGEGFIAHELAETVPFAVTGEKDAVDANGKPTYQGVDLSKVVPVLVAAIQELAAEVNALKNA